jgi:ABC-type transporter Mla subunit MlaD
MNMVDDEPPFTHHLKVRPYRGIEKALDRHNELLATIAAQAAELEALRGEVAPVDAFMSERNEILRLEKYKLEATISQLRARVAALEEAAAKVLPFNVENGPDYASVYFGDGSTHSTQAMTMNPQDWLDLEAALRALLAKHGGGDAG